MQPIPSACFSLVNYLAIMKMVLLATLIIWVSAPLGAAAQKKFDFNENCQQAYQEIIQLKLRSGQRRLNLERENHPDNLIPYLLENYIDFFTLFFNEDPQEFGFRKKNLDARLRILDQGPVGSPYWLFSKAVCHFQWAAIKIKFGNNWDAGWEFRRAFVLIHQNQQLFPDFPPNAMLMGAMQVAAGTIPDGYRWLAELLGIHGTISEGMHELEKFTLDQGPIPRLFHNESVCYYLYLQFYIQNRRREVMDYIRDQKLDLADNHLFTYMASNLAVNAQQAALAEKILQSKSNDSSYLDMPIWDFAAGTARLDRLDQHANIFLERYLARFKGNLYLKDVLQKLSWYYFLQGNLKLATVYREELIRKGTTQTEADKAALREARIGQWPNRWLLQARLLDDGGYFQEALLVLQGKSSGDFVRADEKLEFAYRLGRVYDDLGREEEAIGAYLSTLKLGGLSRAYYPARAALQIGFIYERRGDCKMASSYFQKCLDLKGHDYKNSLDQKAKSGLLRCLGR